MSRREATRLSTVDPPPDDLTGAAPADSVSRVMSRDPMTILAESPVSEAARRMAESGVGSLVVVDDVGTMLGICTDRDITVRVTAVKRGPHTTVREASTCRGVVEVRPNASLADAATIMRRNAVRRLPVVEDGRLVGVLSLGDLALDRDPHSVLADISAADPHL